GEPDGGSRADRAPQRHAAPREERNGEEGAAGREQARHRPDDPAGAKEARAARQGARAFGPQVEEHLRRGIEHERREQDGERARGNEASDQGGAKGARQHAGGEGERDGPVYRAIGMMGPHAGSGSEYDGRHGGRHGDVQGMVLREALGGQNGHEQGDHDHAASDAEEAGGKPDRRPDGKVGQPPVGRQPVRHQGRPRRWAASSANPAPAAAAVTYAGACSRRSPKRMTFATPTDLRKKRNIGASLGESPTNTTPSASRSRSAPKRSRKSRRVMASLS